MSFSEKDLDDDWFCGDGEPKEEEKTAQAETEGDGRATWWYVCGECHGAIDYHDKYCRHCGCVVCWDEK
jgi:hypothetical protein